MPPQEQTTTLGDYCVRESGASLYLLLSEVYILQTVYIGLLLLFHAPDHLPIQCLCDIALFSGTVGVEGSGDEKAASCGRLQGQVIIWPCTVYAMSRSSAYTRGCQNSCPA